MTQSWNLAIAAELIDEFLLNFGEERSRERDKETQEGHAQLQESDPRFVGRPQWLLSDQRHRFSMLSTTCELHVVTLARSNG